MNRTEPPNEGAHWRPARSQKNRACSRHEHRVHPRFIVVLFCLAVARLARPRRAQPNQQRRCSVEWPRIVRGKLFFFEPLDVTHSDTIRAFGFLFVKAIPRPHRSLPPRVLVSALAPVLLLSRRTAVPALRAPGVESSKASAVRSLLLAILADDRDDDKRIMAEVDLLEQARANLGKARVTMLLAMRKILTQAQRQKLRGEHERREGGD